MIYLQSFFFFWTCTTLEAWAQLTPYYRHFYNPPSWPLPSTTPFYFFFCLCFLSNVCYCPWICPQEAENSRETCCRTWSCSSKDQAGLNFTWEKRRSYGLPLRFSFFILHFSGCFSLFFFFLTLEMKAREHVCNTLSFLLICNNLLHLKIQSNLSNAIDGLLWLGWCFSLSFLQKKIPPIAQLGKETKAICDH